MAQVTRSKHIENTVETIEREIRLESDSADTDCKETPVLSRFQGNDNEFWIDLPELLNFTANKATLRTGRNGKEAEPPYRTTPEVRNLTIV